MTTFSSISFPNTSSPSQVLRPTDPRRGTCLVFALHFSIAAHSIDFCSGAFPLHFSNASHSISFLLRSVKKKLRLDRPFVRETWVLCHSLVSPASMNINPNNHLKMPLFGGYGRGALGVWWGTSAQGSRNTCPNTWHSPSMPSSSSSSSPSSYSSHSYSSQLPPLLLLLLLFPLTKHHLSVSPV